MSRDVKILELRNKTIVAEYYKLEEKYPKWKYQSYIEVLSKRFFLAPATISKILNK